MVSEACVRVVATGNVVCVCGDYRVTMGLVVVWFLVWSVGVQCGQLGGARGPQTEKIGEKLKK